VKFERRTAAAAAHLASVMQHGGCYDEVEAATNEATRLGATAAVEAAQAAWELRVKSVSERLEAAVKVRRCKLTPDFCS